MRLRLRLRLLAPLALLPGLVAGCGNDADAQDNPPVGVVRSDRVNVLNATVVTEGDDVGTLVATLLNEAPEGDVLTDVAIRTEEGDVDVVLPDGPVDLPTDEVVRLATDSRVLVVGEGLRTGFFVEVVYEFENAPTLRDVIPVDTAEGEFDGVEVPAPDEVDAPG